MLRNLHWFILTFSYNDFWDIEKVKTMFFFRQCVLISEMLEIVKLLGESDSHTQIISGKTSTSPLSVVNFCNYFSGLLKLIKNQNVCTKALRTPETKVKILFHTLKWDLISHLFPNKVLTFIADLYSPGKVIHLRTSCFNRQILEEAFTTILEHFVATNTKQFQGDDTRRKHKTNCGQKDLKIYSFSVT